MKDNKRLKRKVRNSYIISTISVALVVFLLGSVGYLMTAAMKIAGTLQQSITVTVELDSRISAQNREAIELALEQEPLVSEALFSSREEKLADNDFRRMFESEIEEMLDENPLLDSYELSLTGEASDKTLLDALIVRIGELPGVDRVSYPAMMVERLQSTVRKFQLVLLLFGGALLAISLILLNNTIRLAIFSKRYLINTMKLVGATRGFILRPFLADSLRQGIIAGLIASALFCGAVYGLNEAVPELSSLAEAAKIGIIAGTMTAGSILLSLIFTYWSVARFVRMRANKIYLY